MSSNPISTHDLKKRNKMFTTTVVNNQFYYEVLLNILFSVSYV